MFDGLPDDIGGVDDHPRELEAGGHEDMLLLAGLVAEGEGRRKAERNQWGCTEVILFVAFILLVGFVVLHMVR